jgi:limonene 1,2-monooxygenase
MTDRLRAGIFLAPFHPVDEHPTLAIERDFQLIEHLDRLGYDEAWVGEHHSAGYEIIASPELFIAAAAERTRRIRLGTGVVSLPTTTPTSWPTGCSSSTTRRAGARCSGSARARCPRTR